MNGGGFLGIAAMRSPRGGKKGSDPLARGGWWVLRTLCALRGEEWMCQKRISGLGGE